MKNKQVKCAICLKEFRAYGKELEEDLHFCSWECLKEWRGY